MSSTNNAGTVCKYGAGCTNLTCRRLHSTAIGLVVGCPGYGLAAKDAMFLSPHKFPGGPDTPGILVLKKAIMTNRVPTTPGGGTVFYVTETDHRFLENLEVSKELRGHLRKIFVCGEDA